MPLTEAYDEALKSNFADMAMWLSQAGGAVTTAEVCQRFAGNAAGGTSISRARPGRQGQRGHGSAGGSAHQLVLSQGPLSAGQLYSDADEPLRFACRLIRRVLAQASAGCRGG